MTSIKGDGNTYPDRVSTARAALDMFTKGGILTLFTPNDNLWEWTQSTLYSQMMEFDIITHNITYREFIRTQIPTGIPTVNGSYKIKTLILYGYAAIKGYAAYQDDSFLNSAQMYWNMAWPYFISDEAIKLGTVAGKSPPLRSTCGGVGNTNASLPLLGGVFELDHPAEGTIEIGTSGAFLLLSTLLAEATSNDTYIKAATQTSQFLLNFSKGGTETILSGLENGITESCYNSTRKPLELWYPPTGDLLEGLSIFASINSTVTKYIQTIIRLQTLDRHNQRPDVILDIGPNYIPNYPTGDPFLVRGLMTAYRRNLTAELSNYIKSFIDIQYNALLNNTTYPGTNIYGGSWLGPQSQKFDPINQTYAAMVLVQAIGLAPSPTSTPSPTLTSVNASRLTSTKTGVIAGGVVGGVILIAIVTGLIFLFLCKRRQSHQGPSSVLTSSTPSIFITSSPPSTYGITPFILPEPWEMDVAPKPAKAIISHPNILPATDKLVNPVNLIQGQSMADQLGVDEATNHDDEDDFDSRFQAMSTARIVRILNARLESESLPPSYQSQLGSDA